MYREKLQVLLIISSDMSAAIRFFFEFKAQLNLDQKLNIKFVL